MLKKLKFPIICLSVCFLLIEGMVRIGLFSDYFKIERLRRAELYGGYFDDDDYWKLYYRFNGEHKPPSPKNVHPILGWYQGSVDKDNPLGLWKKNLQLLSSEKDKILFYGDSFVRGVADAEYEMPHYMTNRLNNAVVVDLSNGGHGLAQMFLLFNLTHNKVANPYIMFGILVDDDLDRTILSVRTGQKPYFIVKDEELVLKGVPIDLDPWHYFDKNPPEIKSYLFRLVLRGLSRKFHLLEKHLSKVDKKIKVNTKIIEEIYSVCKRENYPLLFVLFYGRGSLEYTSWKEKFLRYKLQELRIPYINTKDFLIKYAKQHKINPSNFYVLEGKGAGHHNNLGNWVISEELLLRYLSPLYELRDIKK